MPASSFRESWPPEFGCSCGRAAHCRSDARGGSRKVFPRLLEQHTRIPAVRSLSGLPPEHFFGQKAQTNFRNLKILRSNSTRISTDKIWHGLDWSAVASNLRAKDVKQNKQMTLSLSNSTTNPGRFYVHDSSQSDFGYAPASAGLRNPIQPDTGDDRVDDQFMTSS